MTAVDGSSKELRGPLVCLMGHSSLGRFAYRLLLRQLLNLEVAVESDFRPTSVWMAMRAQPDTVIVDSDHAQNDVVEAVQMVTRLRVEVRVLVVSAAIDPTQVEAWGRCPMHGYVVKEAGADEFRAAVEAVLHGREHYSAGTREYLTRGATRHGDAAQLSPRESELLPLLAQGMTLRDAAAHMAIGYKTADSYRSSLLRKLHVRDRVELARYAIRRRIIDP